MNTLIRTIRLSNRKVSFVTTNKGLVTLLRASLRFSKKKIVTHELKYGMISVYIV